MQFAKPVIGGVSAPFGYSAAYFGGSRKHSGVDFYWLNRDVTGSRKVYSAHPGTVVDAGYSSAPGNYVLVDIGGGYKLRYIHLSQIAVKVGQKVGYSTLLGVMGDTGTATQPGQIHLHLDLFKGDTRVDPAPYLTLPFGYTGINTAAATKPVRIEPEEDDMAKIIHDKDKGGYWLVTAIDYLELASSVAVDLYPTFGKAVLVTERQRVQTLACIDTIRSNRRKEFSSPDGSVADLVTKLESIFK